MIPDKSLRQSDASQNYTFEKGYIDNIIAKNIVVNNITTSGTLTIIDHYNKTEVDALLPITNLTGSDNLNISSNQIFINISINNQG